MERISPSPPELELERAPKRMKAIKKRTCSAERCCEDVMDRLKNTIVLCKAHRREAKGVFVVGHDTPVKWCTHCKKAHSINEFAFSLIGPHRKLSCCEKARETRRSGPVNKTASPAPSSPTTSSISEAAKTKHQTNKLYDDDNEGEGDEGGGGARLAAQETAAVQRPQPVAVANGKFFSSMLWELPDASQFVNLTGASPTQMPLVGGTVADRHCHPQRVVSHEEFLAEFDDVLFDEDETAVAAMLKGRHPSPSHASAMGSAYVHAWGSSV